MHPSVALIPLFPLLGAALILLLGRRLGRRATHVLACGSVLAALVVAGLAAPEVLRHGHARSSFVYNWITAGPVVVDVRFVLDPLAVIMTLVVTFVGFLIHVYSTGYMAEEPRYATYFGYLNLFTGAMLILVLADSLPLLFVGWEGVGMCSYLLIGFWFDKTENADAGRKAFVVNRVGDLAFLLGIFLLFAATGELSFSGLEARTDVLQAAARPGGLPLAFWGGLLLFVGAVGKSAQIPLYVWLPDAMAGPTPVSALIHAATMVTAGVYMVARLTFLYRLAPQLMLLIAAVGALTAVVAALIGFAQRDIKKVLAYSTISQLGFLFVGVGVAAAPAAIFHLFTHAFFKAGLFLAAGSVMHALGGRTDIFAMGGLRRRLPITHAVFLIFCLAISGVPPFAGFFSKDEILAAVFVADPNPAVWAWPAWAGPLLYGALFAAALGTAFYMWRLYFLVFAGSCRADEETQHHLHESPASMTAPLIVLALGAALAGGLGLPHAFGLPNAFGAVLASLGEPVHVSAGLTATLMVAATLAALAGIAVAAALYGRGPERGARVAAWLGPVARFVEHRLYVDELYDLIIIRPFRVLAAVLHSFVDRVIIDLVLVRGSALVVELAGRLVRSFQNGDVQRYLAVMIIGVAAVVFFATRPHAGFRVAGAGAERVFLAEVDSGPAGEGARLEWDIDGDGRPEADLEGQRQVAWIYAAPGRYTVHLWVTDGVFGRRAEAHRVVVVRPEEVPE